MELPEKKRMIWTTAAENGQELYPGGGGGTSENFDKDARVIFWV